MRLFMEYNLVEMRITRAISNQGAKLGIFNKLISSISNIYFIEDLLTIN